FTGNSLLLLKHNRLAADRGLCKAQNAQCKRRYRGPQCPAQESGPSDVGAQRILVGSLRIHAQKNPPL
ncbi:MAG: hypothetical protein ACKOAU_15115, partial [Pirellula sp.]